MPTWPFLLLAILAGAMIPFQAGINVRIAQPAGHPIWASLISFIVGTVGLVLYLLAIRAPLPSFAALGTAPSWAWIGGLLGAFYISASIVVAPKLGAAAMIAGVVAGQMLSSLLIDQFGWLGFGQQPITPLRALGGFFLVVGVILIRLF